MWGSLQRMFKPLRADAADRRPVPGLAFNHAIPCDPETGEQATVTYTMPSDATPEEIALAMANISEAGWFMARMHNARKVERAGFVRQARVQKISEAKDQGVKLAKDTIEREEKEINTALLGLKAELIADDQCLGRTAQDRMRETLQRGRVLNEPARPKELNGQGV